MIAIFALAFAVCALAVLGVLAYGGDDSVAAAKYGTAASVPAACAEGDAACAADDVIRTTKRLVACTSTPPSTVLWSPPA